MSTRPKDLTRYKKTYPLTPQVPSKVLVDYRDVVGQTRDLTRFRKTYQFTREAPEVIRPSTRQLSPIEKLFGLSLKHLWDDSYDAATGTWTDKVSGVSVVTEFSIPDALIINGHSVPRLQFLTANCSLGGPSITTLDGRSDFCIFVSFIWPSSSDNSSVLFGILDSGIQFDFEFIFGTGSIEVTINNGSGPGSITCSTPCNDGKIHNAIINCVGGNLEVLIDGISQGTDTGVTLGTFSPNSVLHFGKKGFSLMNASVVMAGIAINGLDSAGLSRLDSFMNDWHGTPTYPTVDSVTPNNGATAGGTSVTIAGSGFQAGAQVYFGGDYGSGIIAASIVVVDSSTITCVTPAAAAGATSVYVVNPDWTDVTSAGAYTYTAPSFIPFADTRVISITSDGSHIWGSSQFAANGTDEAINIQKIDPFLSPNPAVIARANLGTFSDGGDGGTDGIPMRQIRADGQYVFVCMMGNVRPSGVPDNWGAAVAVVDKDTQAIVGRYDLITNNSVSAGVRAICFDGLGNCYVGTTGQSGSTYGSQVLKFVITDMIAAFPSSATPVWSFTTTHRGIENLAYENGHVWITHSQQGAPSTKGVTRIDADGTNEIFYDFTAGLAVVGDMFSWGVYYAFGYVWVSGGPGAGTTLTPLWRFDPSTFPSDPTLVTLPNAGSFSGGEFIASDDSYIYFGGYQFRPYVYRIDPATATVVDTIDLTPGAGRIMDGCYDGVASMWFIGRDGDGLYRVPKTAGTLTFDYHLIDGGP